MASRQDMLRKRVVQFYESHKDEGKRATVLHYKREGVSKSTIYTILKNFETRNSSARKVGSGRPATIMTARRLKWLKKTMKKENQPSTREIGRQLNCSHSYVVKTIKRKSNLQCKKKVKGPRYTEKEKAEVKKSCRKLYSLSKCKDFVLDDEKYFSLSGCHMPGNEYYYTDGKEIRKDAVKTKKKFEAKIMLWLAISKKGISEPYCVPSGIAVKKDIYIKECLEKRLLPFINSNHAKGTFLFWPDKASSHYAGTTRQFLEKNTIDFVLRDNNPTNLPIEDLFGQLAQVVYKNNWIANNIKQLKRRILSCIRATDFTAVQQKCGAIRKTLRKCYEKGPYSLLH